MTYRIAAAIAYYDSDESESLKIGVTPLPVDLSAGEYDNAPRVGARAALPTPDQAVTEPGVYRLNSFDDWYYRIHVIPAQLALGNLAGDTQRTVIVWNAFFHAVTLEDFALDGAGITVDSLVLPPESIPPLEDVTYVFNVSTSGPPVIDGSAVWTIDGVEYTVPITGNRSVLFGFKPDWGQAPVVETLEWKNTLQTMFDGSEQVMRTRQLPRRTIEYRIRVRDNDMRLFDVETFGWAGRIFGVPLWHEKVHLQADAAEGAVALAVDTTHSSFAANGVALLYRDAQDFEILDVATVASGAITINNSLSKPWPRGALVIPVMPGIPNAEFNTSRILPRHLDAAVRFLISPRETVLRLPYVEPSVLYRGYEMYTVETNWAQSISVNIASRRIEVDGGLGAVRIAPKANFPLITRSFSWLLKTRAAADELRAFFARRDGRRVPVWMPSGVEDFKLVSQSELGEAVLRVERSAYGAMIASHPARRDLVLIMRNGDRLPFRINSVEDNDQGGSSINLASGMPYIIRPQDVKRISYLGFYRLETDAVSFSWRSDGVAEVDCRFTLKKEPE